VAALLWVGALPAQAVEHRRTSSYELAEGETLAEELWLAASNAVFAGTTMADISVFAQTITLSGEFGQDVNALASGQLHFRGQARDQLRLAGRYLELAGEAGRSLVAVGGTVALGAESRLRDTAVLVGNTVVVDGQADADVWVIANDATIQGTIGGDLRLMAGDVVILPGTHIRGDVVYSSPQVLNPGRQVRIDGELVRRQTRKVGLSYGAYVLLQALLFAGALVVALPFVRLFPRTVMHSAGILVRVPGRCMLVGVALTWITPLAILVLIWFPVTMEAHYLAGGDVINVVRP
jgi:hypothetical protein